jgi:hypothetical protein
VILSGFVSDTVIGGTEGTTPGGGRSGAANLISGNLDFGISIRLSADLAAGTTIVGNYIGTDSTGTLPIANRVGILVAAPNTRIGGPTPGERNVISGNVGGGIWIDPGPAPYLNRHTELYGNYIGTQTDGRTALANVGSGVSVSASGLGRFDPVHLDIQIGGTAPGQGNTIAFNWGHGIGVGFGTGVSIRRNAIFANEFEGIDLLGADARGRPIKGGPTANDRKDPDKGANNLQNFPELIDVTLEDGSTVTRGELDSHPKKPFTVEFFANARPDPTGKDTAQRFLGEVQVTTDRYGKILFDVPLDQLAADESFTMTTTDGTGNTSEFLITDLRLTDATAKFDPGTGQISKVAVSYAVIGSDLPRPFAVQAYLSKDETLNLEGNDPDSPLRAEPFVVGEKYPRQLRLTGKLPRTIILPLPPTQLTKDKRFILIRVDSGEVLQELDEGNNALFVIPVIQRAFFRSGSVETKLRPSETESSFAGAITGYISRGSDDFGGTENGVAGLKPFQEIWTGIRLRSGTLGRLPDKQFPPVPYADDNYLVNPAMFTPLGRFKDLILLADEQRRLDKLSILDVTAAFNEDGRHSINSSHYEGRAIDFIVNGRVLSRTMVGLGILAGFDWADYENNNHLHFSVRADASPGGFTATVSAESMLQTLDWGRATTGQGGLKLITDNALYLVLRGLMEQVRDATALGLTNVQVRERIQTFQNSVKVGVMEGKIRQGLARGRSDATHYSGSLDKGLLKYNATKLLDAFPV